MKARILIFNLMLCVSVFGQNFWSPTQINQKELKQNKSVTPGDRLYAIDIDAMAAHLRNAPARVNFTIQSNVTLEVPNLYGKSEQFYMAEASNFSPALQAQFPDIRSYRGVNVDNPAITIALSVSPRGVQVMRTEVGAPATFVEAITTDNSLYKVFEKSNISPEWSCATPDELLENDLHDIGEHLARDADDQILRDFRLALSCTGEYAQYFGGSVAGALAGMNATMTRVNPILERDVAVHLTMIDNNADVVFTDPSTDPYSPPSVGTDPFAPENQRWNSQLQSTLTSVIGEANYDIGHLLGDSGGGGNAGCIGCVCNTGKGSAYTSPYDGQPEGDTFDIDYVIHEIGHQLGANHTFSRYEGAGVNYEPGSGSTIMGYAGITEMNVQQHSDDYFHSGSIRQITTNVKNKTCPTEIPIANQPPTADAGPDYTIPIGTPFILTGTATDADGDNLTYCWEQQDSSSPGTGMEAADPNSNTGALVRSLLPTTVPTRYIPSFDKVLEGNLYSQFESVSNVARNMNFAFQVRDNNPEVGQTNSDKVRVGVTANGGAFRVTAPANTDTVLSGEDFTVTWDVAQTDQAPVNVSHVDIYFSTDNGDSFTLLASNVANTGSADVTIPANSQTEEARMMVMAVDNIFYAITNKFYVDYTITSECHSYEAQGLPLDIPDGTTSFGSYAVASFMVSNHGPVDEITVEVDITHSYIGDLQVALQSPSPRQLITLWDRNCSNTDNIVATFDDNGSAVNCSNVSGEIMPSTLLSAFEGFTSQGTWNLGVRDGASGDVGTLNSATATFCTTEANAVSTHDIATAHKHNITVYPNPSNGVFNFELEVEGTGLVYGVYDVTGKLIQSNKDQNATGLYNNQIDLSSYAKGVYILQVRTGNKIINKKLLVK